MPPLPPHLEQPPAAEPEQQEQGDPPTLTDLQFDFRPDAPIVDFVCRAPALQQKFVLYLFSGRRRDGDLPSKRILALANITVLPVDIVFGPHCDLCCDDAVTKWEAGIREGIIVGVLASPPCETWSAARHREGGPPPLRSAAEPWGLAHLSAAQAQQVSIANKLMAAAIRLILAAVVARVPALMEHPAAARNAEYASIWRTEIMAAMLRVATIQLLTFNQGDLGQISPKPTTFLVARLPTLPQRMEERRLPPSQRPEALRMGRSEHGFATAPLKEFPDKLNSAIAFALVDALATGAQAPSDAGRHDHDDANFRDLYQFVTDHAGHVCSDMGADYAPPDGSSAHRRYLREARAFAGATGVASSAAAAVAA